MAITAATLNLTATKGVVVLSGFTAGSDRRLVNNAQGLFQMGQIAGSDVTMNLYYDNLASGNYKVVVEEDGTRTTFTFVVAISYVAPLSVVVTPQAAQPVGSAINVTSAAAGGSGNYAFRLLDARGQFVVGLPDGWSFNASTGALTGTPTVPSGIFGAVVEVRDTTSQKTAQSNRFSAIVNAVQPVAGGGGVTPTICTIPINSNSFYMVASSSDGAARAYKFLRNSGGATGLDTGSPWPESRLTAVSKVASLASDPANPSVTWADDTGAFDTVAQTTTNGQFMGSYHGLGAGGSMAYETVTMDGVAYDPYTVAKSGVALLIENSTTAVNGTSSYSRVLQTSTNAVGGIHYKLVSASGANLNGTEAAYIGMVIGTGTPYSEVIAQYANDGTTWAPLDGYSGEMRIYAAARGIRLRDPTSGKYVQMYGPNMLANASFLRCRILQQTANTREKGYFAFSNLTNVAGLEWDLDAFEGVSGASAFGTTAVTNGDFATDLTGWTASQGAMAWQSPGYLRQTRSATQNKASSIAIASAVNDFIYCRADVISPSPTAAMSAIKMGTSNALSDTGALVNQQVQGGSRNGFLIKTGLTSQNFGFQQAAGTAGETIDFDNAFVTVKGQA